MAPFTTEVDRTDPAAFYLGDGSLAELADVAIMHRASGLRLPAHSHILAQQSRVMRDLFLSLHGQASGRKRKAHQEDGAAVELESPFNDYSLQEVCFLLRFVYRPSDLTDSNLESVEQHLPGITRLANSLNATVHLAAIDKLLAVRAARSRGDALKWVQLAEECGLDAAWAAGVRALATSFISPPLGAPLAHRGAIGLRGLSRETIVAVLAAVAAAIRNVDARLLKQAAAAIPGAAVMLAGRNEAALGSASLVWEVPQLASLRERREAPAFGSSTDSITGPTFKLAVKGRVPVPAGQAAVPYGYGAQPSSGLAVYLMASWRDDCPPGIAIAAEVSVQLIGENDVVVVSRRLSQTLSKSAATMEWLPFMESNHLASRLNANAGNGTFKVQVDWLELQPDAEEE